MYNGGIPKKYTFRFGNISFRFTIVEHFVLRIIVANEVVKCTKDEIKSTTNTFIPGLGILASNLIDGSINDVNVKNMFFRNNNLELKDSWFWNRGILYNSYKPEGTTVSFGICGFVIPLVEWEDFKLMEE